MCGRGTAFARVGHMASVMTLRIREVVISCRTTRWTLPSKKPTGQHYDTRFISCHLAHRFLTYTDLTCNNRTRTLLLAALMLARALPGKWWSLQKTFLVWSDHKIMLDSQFCAPKPRLKMWQYREKETALGHTVNQTLAVFEAMILWSIVTNALTECPRWWHSCVETEALQQESVL